jgi:hypothetical protein
MIRTCTIIHTIMDPPSRPATYPRYLFCFDKSMILNRLPTPNSPNRTMPGIRKVENGDPCNISVVAPRGATGSTKQAYPPASAPNPTNTCISNKSNRSSFIIQASKTCWAKIVSKGI